MLLKQNFLMRRIKARPTIWRLLTLNAARLVIADEILQNRRAVERFAKLAGNLH
jgi:hypothetical protein